MPDNRLDFAQLFRDHYPRVYRYVRYRVDNDADAEDLTAEIFERAYRYRHTYDPSRARFSTWIGQIAHNWVNNFLVGRSRHDDTMLPAESLEDIAVPSESLPESQTVLREAVTQLLLCLKRLTQRDRQVIALRFASEMRNKDIAELMGLKERTVSVIILRALERLRSCHEEHNV